MFIKRISLLIALASLLVGSAAAQTVTGTLQGTITDKSGGALPGVTVTVRNMETGLEHVTITNDKGFYSAPFLPIGRYVVNAELSGFGRATLNNVGIELNTTTVKNIVMAPQMSETVTVSAEAPHVDVTDAEIKQTLTSKEI